MREKWKGWLILIFACTGISFIAYHEAAMKGFLGVWGILLAMVFISFIIGSKIGTRDQKNDAELSKKIHELFHEKKTVEVSLHVIDEELKKIKEVFKKNQIVQFYAKLVDEEIRVTMKIGKEEYTDFFVYRNYSEFVQKFNVLE